MSLISRSRKQVACYWDVTGFGDDGQPIYAAPVQIKCRWEERQEIFADQEGKERVSKAKVYVDRDIQLRGVLWLGKLEDLLDEDEPFNNPDAFSIQKKSKIPDLKAKEFLRECWL